MGKHLDKMREVANHQGGVFANYQVEVPKQAIHYHAKNDHLERLQTGIYRVADYPTSEDEEYIVAYLWSETEGVISHQTALFVHELSDVLPSRIHLTVPESWRTRNKQIPDPYELHYADLADRETQWHDVVPVTTPLRTIEDVALEGLDPDLVEQAIDEAKSRGLVGAQAEREILRFLILHHRNDE